MYAILGFAINFPIGKGKISFADGGSQDQPLAINGLPEPELGLGARFGSLSFSAVFQFSLISFVHGEEGVDPPPPNLGKAAGIMFAAGWQLPR